MIPATQPPARRARGFTLTELAIAFLVISLLLSGMLMTLAAQNEGRQLADTQRTLDNAREALIGFAVRFGRLPCPAFDGATGDEARRDSANAFTCQVCLTTDQYCEGMLPALTLGIGPIDAQGYLIDAWGNRVRYAVTNWSFSAVDVTNCPPNGAKDFKKCPAFTTANAVASLGMTNAPSFSTQPAMLRICDVAACSGRNSFAPAVVWSPGKNFIAKLGPPPTFGADEGANLNTPADGNFVMHEARTGNAPGGEFDDIVTWISPSVFYSRLVSAGAI